MLDFLGRRPGERHQQMVGTVTESRFEGIRLEVLSKLQMDVKDVMAAYEKGKGALGVWGMEGWIVGIDRGGDSTPRTWMGSYSHTHPPNHPKRPPKKSKNRKGVPEALGGDQEQRHADRRGGGGRRHGRRAGGGARRGRDRYVRTCVRGVIDGCWMFGLGRCNHGTHAPHTHTYTSPDPNKTKPPHNQHTGGLITASTLALLGLVVLPYRRSAQRADFRRRVGELRKQMDQALAVRCV